MEASAETVAAQVPFAAVGGAPLRGGFIKRLPGDGRGVIARELYVLDEAVPDRELEVRLLVHLFDPTCSNRPVPFAASGIRTDGAGNGAAQLAVRVEDVPEGVRDARHGVRWEVRSGETVLYRTDCTSIELSWTEEEER